MRGINNFFVDWEKIILRDGAELFIKNETSYKEYDFLIGELNDLGYKTEIERFEGDVKFLFLKKDKETLYTSYTPQEERIRIIKKLNGELYLNENYVSSVKTTPLITQVKLSYFSVDCGMCYIIRLSDGKFVIIDSGIGEYEEDEHIFELLKEQSPEFEKPIIAAWFLSHAHEDHFGAFISFINKYREDIYLENLIYNWEKIGDLDITDFEKTLETIKADTKIIIARTGQSFRFSDCVFDLLFTGEDLYPQEICNLNDTSLIMRMDLSGHRVLWLGDAMNQSSDYICSRYDERSFKCEFLQVGHHGYAGGSEQLYKWANPEILLWPCPDFWYPVVKEWKPNEILLNSKNMRQNLISGQQEIVIDLTKPISDFKPYTTFKNGETIYYENFHNKRVIDLGWSCITGGNTGYSPLDIVVNERECNLTAKDVFSVCELVKLGQIKANPDFTFKISGVSKSNTGEFGMFWNYDSPTVFNEDKIIWFKNTEEGNFEYTFSSDFAKKQMILYFYDKEVCEFTYDKMFPLCLVMKNCCIELKELKLVNGTLK